MALSSRIDCQNSSQQEDSVLAVCNDYTPMSYSCRELYQRATQHRKLSLAWVYETVTLSTDVRNVIALSRKEHIIAGLHYIFCGFLHDVM